MQINLIPLTLEETFMLSTGVKHFVFRSEQSPAFHYLAGQFITLHFEHEGKSLKRSYSIANVPQQDNRIEFAAGYVAKGPGSELLFHLQPGDKINISGPFGRLILKNEIPQRYVLVATSTGVTPYRAMLTELGKRLEQHPSLKVLIMLGVQTVSDALYADEFLQFAAAFPNQVEFRLQLSRATDAELLEPHQHKGYVQHAFTEIALNPKDDVVYLCGNPGMIDAAFEDLKARGFTMQQIIREKYISAR